MSTFPGRIPELPGIMIDRLMPDPDLKAFFISHDHSDHTRGIYDERFHSFMATSSPQRFIYVSPLTAQMMRNRSQLEPLHDLIIPLELDEPHEIRIDGAPDHPPQSENRELGRAAEQQLTSTGETRPLALDGYTLNVTLTSAEHIMGSVMFVFERATSPSFRCLYTGDFRLTINEIKAKRCLRLGVDRSPGGQHTKPFDAVYFDSTWCTPRHLWTIPLREEALRELKPLIERHLLEDQDNLICLYTCYNIGYEILLQWLARVSHSKIHVTEGRLMLYRGFAGMEDILSTDADCRVHFCTELRRSQARKLCPRLRRASKGKALSLVASYMRFIKEHTDNAEMSTCVKDARMPDQYNVCWSTHPSLEEVLGLLNYLNPRRACPNVVGNDTSEEEILDTLRRPATETRAWHPKYPLDTSEPPLQDTQRPLLKKVSPKKPAPDIALRPASPAATSGDDSPEEGIMERLRIKGLATSRRPRKAISLSQLQSCGEHSAFT